MENNIHKYVESISNNDLTAVISDTIKTDERINKLQSYIDELDDKKVSFDRHIQTIMSRTNDRFQIDLLNDKINQCDDAIRKIKDDISYIKTMSYLYSFHKSARKILNKTVLKNIENDLNANDIINKVSVGSKLKCIINSGIIERDSINECESIDKFNAMITFKNVKGYHNIYKFRLVY